MKRGQVTVYIIVGLIALVAVVLTLYVNQEYIKSALEQKTARLEQAPQEIQPLEIHIQSCLESTSKLSTNIIYLQGGYLEPKYSVPLESLDVSYWYYKKDISPTLETIQNEIGKSMSYLLEGCISDFDSNYIITIEKITPKITIKDVKLIAAANVLARAEYKNITYDINNNYETSFDSNAANLYKAAKVIVSSEIKDPKSMDLTLLSSLPYNTNFFKFNETFVYAISAEDLTLMFANKLEIEE